MNFVLTVVRGVMADAHYDQSENITADGQWQYLNGLTIMKMIVANILQIAFWLVIINEMLNKHNMMIQADTRDNVINHFWTLSQLSCNKNIAKGTTDPGVDSFTQ